MQNLHFLKFPFLVCGGWSPSPVLRGNLFCLYVEAPVLLTLVKNLSAWEEVASSTWIYCTALSRVRS